MLTRLVPGKINNLCHPFFLFLHPKGLFYENTLGLLYYKWLLDFYLHRSYRLYLPKGIIFLLPVKCIKMVSHGNGSQVPFGVKICVIVRPFWVNISNVLFVAFPVCSLERKTFSDRNFSSVKKKL